MNRGLTFPPNRQRRDAGGNCQAAEYAGVRSINAKIAGTPGV
ncbi:MAG TPA: hypothetical protein VFA55_08165 [Candidatus Kapabacteria bacterium]|nr:hypothetical protein [Candidatus Kapabacteria bacterium]